jgi:hypothetical protein
MATAFTAEVDRLREKLRAAEADAALRFSEAQTAGLDIERLTARIRDLEARPVGGAAEMREAAARLVEERARYMRGAAGAYHEAAIRELAVMANEIRALPLPTPSPSTEPDAVPEIAPHVAALMCSPISTRTFVEEQAAAEGRAALRAHAGKVTP